MKRFTNTKAIARAVAVVGSVMVLVGGVTFAALQSQQSTIKGNTIQTAMASLKLSADGQTYTNSVNGFSFDNLMLGQPGGDHTIYLKNTGQTNLNVKLSAGKIIDNPQDVDLSKVKVLLASLEGGVMQSFTLDQLQSSLTTGGVPVTMSSAGPLYAGQEKSFIIEIEIDSDAVTAPSATLSNIDFNYDATTVNQ